MFFTPRRSHRVPISDIARASPPSCTRLVNVIGFIGGSLLGCLVTALTILTALREKTTQISIIPQDIFSPQIPISWVPDERYIGFSNSVNLRWHNLVKTTESVWISNAPEYGLRKGFTLQNSQPSAPTPPPHFYHISNLHQLHCLNILRGQYFQLYHNISSLSQQSKEAAKDSAHHVDHCIEYLRMTIMCGGNWDVEADSPPGTPPELKTDPFGHPIGWGGVRNCVNWDALMTWQRKNMEIYKDTWGNKPDHSHS